MSDDNPPIGPLNRRAMLAVGGAATASAALLAAGCATYSTNDAPASGAPAAPEPAGAPSGAASGPGGTALGPASSVPVGGGKIFAEQAVVVTQPTEGTWKAFSTTCPHQGCAVTSVSGGTINCPCHGSEFKIADGSVATGPAKKALAAKNVTSEGGTLRLS